METSARHEKKLKKNSQRHINHIILEMSVSLTSLWVIHTVISFEYLAEVAKSALLCCHVITHSLAACAHVAPGSWSRIVSSLHQQRLSFLTRTEIGNRTRSTISSCPFKRSKHRLNASRHSWDLLILTFRKDINSSMPSLSNLERGEGG